MLKSFRSSVSTLGISVILVFSLASCSVDDRNRTPELRERLVISGEDIASRAKRINEMPTPNELFNLVEDLIGVGDKKELVPVRDSHDLIDKYTKAFYLGMYATDLSYASHFGLNVEVVRYYVAVKRLGEEIGIGKAFDDNDLRRLERNLSNGDSLAIVSNNSYYKAYERLREEDNGATLVMVLAGGWVESTHLLIDRIETVEDDRAPLVKRLAEQEVALTQLLDMMLQVEDRSKMERVLTDLIGILNIYDQLGVRRSPDRGKETKGKMVISSDVERVLTQKKLEELDAAITRLRSHMMRDQRTKNNNS